MWTKNVKNIKCAPKLTFFNEKKMEKDSDNFWLRKLTLKVNFLTLPHQPNSQNLIISFEYVNSDTKIFLILCPSFENFTTRIAIVQIKSDLINFMTTLCLSRLIRQSMHASNVSLMKKLTLRVKAGTYVTYKLFSMYICSL